MSSNLVRGFLSLWDQCPIQCYQRRLEVNGGIPHCLLMVPPIDTLVSQEVTLSPASHILSQLVRWYKTGLLYWFFFFLYLEEEDATSPIDLRAFSHCIL